MLDRLQKNLQSLPGAEGKPAAAAVVAFATAATLPAAQDQAGPIAADQAVPIAQAREHGPIGNGRNGIEIAVGTQQRGQQLTGRHVSAIDGQGRRAQGLAQARGELEAIAALLQQPVQRAPARHPQNGQQSPVGPIGGEHGRWGPHPLSVPPCVPSTAGGPRPPPQRHGLARPPQTRLAQLADPAGLPLVLLAIGRPLVAAFSRLRRRWASRGRAPGHCL